MARITVEDCLEKIPNRFQLVLAATYRARMLSQGHAPKIESKNKPGVTALREIADGRQNWLGNAEKSADLIRLDHQKKHLQGAFFVSARGQAPGGGRGRRAAAKVRA